MTVRPARAGAVEPFNDTGVFRGALVTPDIETADEKAIVLLGEFTELRLFVALTRNVFLPAVFEPQVKE